MGIALLAMVILIGVLLFWLTHRDASLKENYRDDIQTGGDLEAAYLKNGPYAASYYEDPAFQVFEKYEISYPAELETENKKYPWYAMVLGGRGPSPRHSTSSMPLTVSLSSQQRKLIPGMGLVQRCAFAIWKG